MPRKVNVLAMLIAIISLVLVCTSLVTFKWFVDTEKEIGVFGICQYKNNSTFSQIISKEDSKRIILENSNGSLERIIQEENITHIEPNITKNHNQTESFGQEIVDYFKSTKVYEFFSGSSENKQCFNLLWPSTDEAFDYLAPNSTYLTAIMGVAIASVTMGFLTFVWSFICTVSTKVGSHPRASELSILLATLADVLIISTYGMFMFKDKHLIIFSYFGISFWLSVGSSCGFFLSSILFSVNRVNIGFKYQLDNYQRKFSEP